MTSLQQRDYSGTTISLGRRTGLRTAGSWLSLWGLVTDWVEGATGVDMKQDNAFCKSIGHNNVLVKLPSDDRYGDTVVKEKDMQIASTNGKLLEHFIPPTTEIPKEQHISEVCVGSIDERSNARALQQNNQPNQPEGSTREPLSPISDGSCLEHAIQVKIEVPSEDHATLPGKEVPSQDPAMFPRKEVPTEDPAMHTEVPSEDPETLSGHLQSPNSTSVKRSRKRSRKKNKRASNSKKARTNE